MIHFVVEHTGYPAEVVELDADLEADLGIDSIKKAQLFGELREYFDVTPDANLTLDDFPTLRHVLNYLKGAAPAGKAAAVVEDIREIQPQDLTSGRELYSSPAELDGNGSTTAAPTPTTGAAPTPTADTVAVIAPPAEQKKDLDSSELESFLINFVVEHTGYPAEVVELDADLEADLGIDSIKKAQLFGELREYFDVTPDANLTLDDFPTLRHVLNYLKGAAAGETATAKEKTFEQPQPVQTVSVAPAEAAFEPTNRMAEIAAESFAPSKIVPEPMPQTGAATQTVAVMAPPAEQKKDLDSSELESFLINFVVEHTGYPAEVVELDADLEADLGIDSIKKAQLFGELREYFDVTPDANLTLDDFPTLRHVLNYLKGAAPASKATSDTAGDSPILAAQDSKGESPIPQGGLGQSPAYETGFAYGQKEKERIREALHRYADVAGSEFDQTRLGGDLSDPRSSFTHQQLDELQGIADGAQVALENIAAYNVLHGDSPISAGQEPPHEASARP